MTTALAFLAVIVSVAAFLCVAHLAGVMPPRECAVMRVAT